MIVIKRLYNIKKITYLFLKKNFFFKLLMKNKKSFFKFIHISYEEFTQEKFQS